MSLIKWEEIDDLVPFSRHQQFGFTPAVDMYEDHDNVVVETQLGGIDPAAVNISIENDVLCIKGESEKKSEAEDKNYYRKEIRRGSFFRSIPLPTKVNGEKAEANVAGGILKIVIPKLMETKTKNIKIKIKQ